MVYENRAAFIRELFKGKLLILIDNSQISFIKPSDFPVAYSSMIHLHKRLVTNVLVEKCFYDRMLFRYPHVWRYSC